MSRQLTEADVLALAAAVAGSGGGSGDGDMKKSVYDSDDAVADAGGIDAYINSKAFTTAEVNALKALL